MNAHDAPPSERRPGFAALAIGIGVFVGLGIPLTAYVWETLNQLMAGHVVLARLLVTIPVFAILVALLVFLARAIRRWDGERPPGPAERRVP